MSIIYRLLTKITAAQNEVALTYHRVRGLYFLAVIFGATVIFRYSHTPANQIEREADTGREIAFSFVILCSTMLSL